MHSLQVLDFIQNLKQVCFFYGILTWVCVFCLWFSDVSWWIWLQWIWSSKTISGFPLAEEQTGRSTSDTDYSCSFAV